MKNLLLGALLVLALPPFRGGEAEAHAWLDYAVPAVGSTVHAPPAELCLRFTQELEPAFSTARVVDESGKQVDGRNPQVDGRDRTVLKLSLPPFKPGNYKVIWRVLSIDTHVTEGDYTFRVSP
jgi:methionine-rich copper-binding protein CopC